MKWFIYFAAIVAGIAFLVIWAMCKVASDADDAMDRYQFNQSREDGHGGE